MELLRCLVGKMQSRRSECKATTRQMAERNVTMAEMDLKIRLLADKAGQSGKMHRWVNAVAGELFSTKKVPEARDSALIEKIHKHGCLEQELKAAQAAIGRERGITTDFTKRVCTGHTSLKRVQSYCN